MAFKSVVQHPSYDWESFNSVRRWKRGLIKQNFNQVLAKKTWRTYSTYFPEYLTFTGKNPDELIEECLVDSEVGCDQMMAYYQKLCERVAKSTALMLTSGVVRGFYTHNKINTMFWSMPKLPIKDVEKTDEELPLFNRTDTKTLVLNRDLLISFFKKLSERDEAIALCMLSSSLDIGDILDMKIGDIKYQVEDRLYFHGQRPKTAEEYKTFCSKEATKRIRRYYENYRSFAKDDEFLFVSTHGTPLSGTVVDRNFRLGAKNLGLRLVKTKQSPLRPKRFRKVFQSGCQLSGIPIQAIQTFMGHKGEQVKTYMGKSKEELLAYYEQAEPHLTVYEDVISSSELEELQKQVKILQKENQDNSFRFVEIISSISQNPELVKEVLKSLRNNI